VKDSKIKVLQADICLILLHLIRDLQFWKRSRIQKTVSRNLLKRGVFRNYVMHVIRIYI